MFVGQSSWFYELLKNSRGRYGAIGKVQVRKYVRLSLLYMCIKFHACSRNQLFYMNFWKILGGAVELFGQAQVLGDSLSSSWWSFFYIWSCTVKLRAFHSSWPDGQNGRPSRPHHVTQLQDFNNFSSWRGQDATQRIWSRWNENPWRSALHSKACTAHFLGGAVEFFWNFKSRDVFFSGFCMCVQNFIAVRETIRINSTRTQFSRWRYWVILLFTCLIPQKYKIFRQSWCVCEKWGVFEFSEGVKLGFKEA